MTKSLIAGLAILGLTATASADMSKETANIGNATKNISSAAWAGTVNGVEATGRFLNRVVVQPLGQTAEGAYTYLLKPTGEAATTVGQDIKKGVIKAGGATADAGTATYEKALKPTGQDLTAAGNATGEAATAAGTATYDNVLTPIGHGIKKAGMFSYNEVLLPIGNKTAEGATFIVVKAKSAAKFLGHQSADAASATWNEVLVPVGTATKDGIKVVVMPTKDFVVAVGQASMQLSGDASATVADGVGTSVNASRELVGLDPVMKTDRAAQRKAKRKALKGN